MHAPVTARRLTDAQRIAWLRLIRSENVGPRTFRNLLNHCGSAAVALEALPDLARRGGALIGPRDHDRRSRPRTKSPASPVSAARLIALGEPEYPPVLAASDGAPPLISIIGDPSCLARPAIGIVGARNASAAGRSFASRLARELGEAGFTIVSGLARGVDAAAHEASLSTGTVAVLAGGVDRIYPPENVRFSTGYCRPAALITEMPLGWEPRARDFPRRNRIIAGLSRGVVVVEAALRSGSLITARLAAEMGREVMAAPGSPLDPRCEGSNALLRDGATLITRAEHVIEALGASLGSDLDPPPPLPFAEPEAPLMQADNGARGAIEELLGPSPALVDDIVRLSGAPARMVQLVLLELELAGRLERHAGGRVSLIG